MLNDKGELIIPFSYKKINGLTGDYFKVFDGFPRQKDGYVTLSDKPGLGLEINEKEIKKHPPFVNTNARGGANKTI